MDSCPKEPSTPVRVQASFILKGEGVWLLVAHFLVPASFVLTNVHAGVVTMFLYTCNKIVIFCSATF